MDLSEGSAVQQATFTIESSQGILTARADDGTVLTCQPFRGADAPECIECIARFDVDEFRRRYPTANLEDATVDVLDLGYWTKDGRHELPCEDFRDIVAPGGWVIVA